MNIQGGINQEMELPMLNTKVRVPQFVIMEVPVADMTVPLAMANYSSEQTQTLSSKILLWQMDKQILK